MYKRGVSHIEMILAFFIFIGAVIFLHFTFNPLETQRVKIHHEDYALENLDNLLETHMNVTYVIINDSVINGAKDIRVRMDTRFEYPYVLATSDKNGNNIVKAKKIDVNLIGIERNPTDNELIIISVSQKNDLGNNPNQAESTKSDSSFIENDSYYYLISYDTIDAISYTNTNNLISDYDDSVKYNSLKTALGLPNLAEFSFSLLPSKAGEFVALLPSNIRIPPEDAQVSTKVKSVMVFDNGKFYGGILQISVW